MLCFVESAPLTQLIGELLVNLVYDGKIAAIFYSDAS